MRKYFLTLRIQWRNLWHCGQSPISPHISARNMREILCEMKKKYCIGSAAGNTWENVSLFSISPWLIFTYMQYSKYRSRNNVGNNTGDTWDVWRPRDVLRDRCLTMPRNVKVPYWDGLGMVSWGPHEVIRMMIRGLSTPQDNSVGLMKMI